MSERRTLVYAPADRPWKVERAANSAADAVILDLESTVGESDKDRARESLDSLLSEQDFDGKETVVRINGLRTSRWLADLEAAVEANADAIRLPKIEHPREVETAVEAAGQFVDSPPEFLLQIETPDGLVNGPEIASTCAEFPAVTGLGVGMGDYTTALGVPDHTPELRTFLLNRIAAFASVGDMDPLGYVHKDQTDLRDVATQARNLGHVGQPVSHTVPPEEFVPVLNDVYSG